MEMNGRLNVGREYTFDSFICGNNQEAYYAAYYAAVDFANGNTSMFSPLLIYGDIGVGKTHLLKSIETEALNRMKPESIEYTDGELFSKELIIALEKNRMRAFLEKYFNLDYLIFDDLHLVSGRHTIQDELIRISKLRLMNNKATVFGCNTTGLQTLDRELKSLALSGLPVELGEYDQTSKEEILFSKLEQTEVDKKIYEYIRKFAIQRLANVKTTDIRILEGHLKRIIFFMKTFDVEPNEKQWHEIITAIDEVTDFNYKGLFKSSNKC